MFLYLVFWWVLRISGINEYNTQKIEEINNEQKMDFQRFLFIYQRNMYGFGECRSGWISFLDWRPVYPPVWKLLLSWWFTAYSQRAWLLWSWTHDSSTLTQNEHNSCNLFGLTKCKGSRLIRVLHLTRGNSPQKGNNFCFLKTSKFWLNPSWYSRAQIAHVLLPMTSIILVDWQANMTPPAQTNVFVPKKEKQYYEDYPFISYPYHTPRRSHLPRNCSPGRRCTWPSQGRKSTRRSGTASDLRWTSRCTKPASSLGCL